MEVASLSLDDVIAAHRLREGYPPDEFTLAVVAGVLAARTELDALLEAHATDWPLSRVAPLERSILRLAAWEIRAGSTPAAVAIDEAVRLTRTYSTDDAAAFVNGVLGGLVAACGDDVDGCRAADPADSASGALEAADEASGDDQGGDDRDGDVRRS